MSDGSTKALKYDLVTNAKITSWLQFSFVLRWKLKDNFKLIKAIPFIDKFTIKNIEIYKILR